MRQLSNHIASRWYRSPEIILIEKIYNQSVDIWALGCILGEMLNCMSIKDVEKRFLFPGESCYPLTPCGVKSSEINIVSQEDQMKKILETLGQ